MKANLVAERYLLRCVYWAVDYAVCEVVHDRVHSPLHQTVQGVVYGTPCRSMYRAVNWAVYDPPHPSLSTFLSRADQEAP
jgi:hypothetical protein